MKKKQIPIFATHADLILLFESVRTGGAIQIVKMINSESGKIEVIEQLSELQYANNYLVLDASLNVSARSVPQRDGSMIFVVDAMSNPHSVVVRCGNRIGDRHLTAGDVGVATGDSQAESLFYLFQRVIKQKFQSIRSYYLGPEAFSIFNEGGRLSISLKSPRQFDLARP